MSQRKLGYLSPDKTLFLLCDVQEKFRVFDNFDQLVDNTKIVVSMLKILRII